MPSLGSVQALLVREAKLGSGKPGALGRYSITVNIRFDQPLSMKLDSMNENYGRRVEKGSSVQRFRHWISQKYLCDYNRLTTYPS